MLLLSHSYFSSLFSSLCLLIITCVASQMRERPEKMRPSAPRRWRASCNQRSSRTRRRRRRKKKKNFRRRRRWRQSRVLPPPVRQNLSRRSCRVQKRNRRCLTALEEPKVSVLAMIDRWHVLKQFGCTTASRLFSSQPERRHQSLSCFCVKLSGPTASCS